MHKGRSSSPARVGVMPPRGMRSSTQPCSVCGVRMTRQPRSRWVTTSGALTRSWLTPGLQNLCSSCRVTRSYSARSSMFRPPPHSIGYPWSCGSIVTSVVRPPISHANCRSIANFSSTSRVQTPSTRKVLGLYVRVSVDCSARIRAHSSSSSSSVSRTPFFQSSHQPRFGSVATASGLTSPTVSSALLTWCTSNSPASAPAVKVMMSIRIPPSDYWQAAREAL